MSNKNFSYIFSPSLLWGNVSSQSVTGLCNHNLIASFSQQCLYEYKHHSPSSVPASTQISNNRSGIDTLYNQNQISYFYVSLGTFLSANLGSCLLSTSISWNIIVLSKWDMFSTLNYFSSLFLVQRCKIHLKSR